MISIKSIHTKLSSRILTVILIGGLFSLHIASESKPASDSDQIPSFADFKSKAVSLGSEIFKPKNPMTPLTAEYRTWGPGLAPNQKVILYRNTNGLVRCDHISDSTMELSKSAIYDFTNQKKWDLRAKHPSKEESLNDEDKKILELLKPQPHKSASIFESKENPNLLGWTEVDTNGIEHRILVDRITGIKLLGDSTDNYLGTETHCMLHRTGEPDKTLFVI